jgi:hypothetical protein
LHRLCFRLDPRRIMKIEMDGAKEASGTKARIWTCWSLGLDDASRNCLGEFLR